jgi:hypothetical protein
MFLAVLVLVGHLGELARRRRLAVHGRALALAVGAAGVLGAMAWGADVQMPSLLLPVAGAAALYLVWALATGRVRVPGAAFLRARFDEVRAGVVAAARPAAVPATAPEIARSPAPLPVPVSAPDPAAGPVAGPASASASSTASASASAPASDREESR